MLAKTLRIRKDSQRLFVYVFKVNVSDPCFENKKILNIGDAKNDKRNFRICHK